MLKVFFVLIFLSFKSPGSEYPSFQNPDLHEIYCTSDTWDELSLSYEIKLVISKESGGEFGPNPKNEFNLIDFTDINDLFGTEDANYKLGTNRGYYKIKKNKDNQFFEFKNLTLEITNKKRFVSDYNEYQYDSILSGPNTEIKLNCSPKIYGVDI